VITVTTTVKMSDQEKELLGVLDKIREAIADVNRLGVGDYQSIAIQQDDYPYGALHNAFIALASDLFECSEAARNLMDLCIDNGESAAWNIEKNADRIVFGSGR
jgi:hypothetical protein